jgi:hypothetical protein
MFTQIVYFVVTASVVMFTLRKRSLLRLVRRVVPSQFKMIERYLVASVAKAVGDTKCVFFCKT